MQNWLSGWFSLEQLGHFMFHPPQKRISNVEYRNSKSNGIGGEMGALLHNPVKNVNMVALLPPRLSAW